MNNPVKITVATVTYNAANVIARTLSSVEQQDYPYVEHLVIDGNSHDGTLAEFLHYQERNAREVRHEVNAVSEPDKGIYDAMNKALAMATGDYIVFLNAGDKFHNEKVLSHIAACASSDTGVIYGDTDIVDFNGNFIRHRRLSPPEHLTSHCFLGGMLVCHQAFFARTDIARNIKYNLSYSFSADYDWCIRIMRRTERMKRTLVNSHTIVADYLDGGTTVKNHRKSLVERFVVMSHRYGIFHAAAMHLWFILRTFIKK